MILVTGATGNIGRELVPQLLAKGQALRVVTRDAAKVAQLDPRIERIIGDLRDPDAVKRAVDCAERIFMVSLIADPTQTADRMLLEELRRAGVRQIVKISSRGTGESGIGKLHRDGERQVQASGIAWTFLRPGMFMSNTLGWAPTIKAQGAVYSPFGDGKMAMIAPRDIAAVAAEALTDRRHEGQIVRSSRLAIAERPRAGNDPFQGAGQAHQTHRHHPASGGRAPGGDGSAGHFGQGPDRPVGNGAQRRSRLSQQRGRTHHRTPRAGFRILLRRAQGGLS